jgi:hypothetical protein
MIMRKWKWVFVNGCESKKPVSVMVEFLKLYQARTEIVLKWSLSGTFELHLSLYEGGPKKNRIFFKKYNLFTFQTKNT